MVFLYKLEFLLSENICVQVEPWVARDKTQRSVGAVSCCEVRRVGEPQERLRRLSVSALSSIQTSSY